MDPKLYGKILTTHRRGYGVDVEALRGRFPSGEAPAKAPRWDLMDTEGYGGGNCFSLAPWMFSGYVGIYRRKEYIGGGTGGPRGWRARPCLVGPSGIHRPTSSSYIYPRTPKTSEAATKT